eukprot:gene4008-4287_t
MSLSDKVIGSILVTLSIFIFVYYTFWVLILPFIEKKNVIYNYFLPQEYAIAIPAILLVTGIVVIGSFIGYVLIKESSKKKKK